MHKSKDAGLESQRLLKRASKCNKKYLKGEKMKKLFISQPMKDRTDEEILKERERAIKIVEEKLGERVEVIDSFAKRIPSSNNIPLWNLGKSIQLLAEADVAFFAKGWQEARGCKIELDCAIQYGIMAITE